MGEPTRDVQIAAEQGSRRFQLGLSEIAVGVLGCGLFAGLVRASYAGETPQSIDADRIIALGAIAVALFMGFSLVARILRLLVSPEKVLGSAHARGDQIRALAWSVIAIVLVVAFLSGETRILGLAAQKSELLDMNRLQARIQVVPYAFLLFLVGLGAGWIPVRPQRVRPPERFWWLSTLLAAVAGVLLVALEPAAISYLVLLVLDVVRDALRHGPAWRPGVSLRVIWCLPAAVVASSSCLASALLGVQILRKASGGRPSVTWRAALARVTTMIAALASSAYLVVVTVPQLHEHLADGMHAISGPVLVTAVLGGFMGLAAGLCARAIAPKPILATNRVPSARGRHASVGAAIVLMTVLALLAGSAYLRTSVPRLARGGLVAPGLARPLWLDSFLGWIDRNFLEWTLLGSPPVPRKVFWIAILIILFRWGIALTRRTSERLPAPFDVVLSNPSLARRFFWSWILLSVAFVTALPSLAVSGLVVFHFGIRALAR
jgi:hypothetical protein